MIPFKMNILSYNPTGSYSVEYVPEKPECTPIKLNIQLDTALLASGDKDEILYRLRASSPQDYWSRELALITTSNFDPSSLINTTYAVNTPVTTDNIEGVSSPSQFEPARSVELPNIGSSTPEQRVSSAEQQRVKLKLIIQEVIEEMAEGTV